MAKRNDGKLWTGIEEQDFIDSLKDVEEQEIREYDYDKMVIFSANINYARQLTRLSDSLTPVQRRILYTMYTLGSKPGTKIKSAMIVGKCMEYHPHGDSSIYSSMVNMTQYWKKPIPLVKGKGNFGTEVLETYAHQRYTEAEISDYAWNCFFKDYDDECVQTIVNTTVGHLEPVSLPSRYPNALINGGTGIAVGNAYRIPPYNINDIINVTKKLLFNPNAGPIYMVPDLPTGCDIIDSGELKRICEHGEGTLRMRARVEILDTKKTWTIRITNLPWTASLESFKERLAKLAKSGELPIKDASDAYEQVIMPNGEIRSPVDFRITIDKAHDPKAFVDKLYKKTELDKSVAINFKVVLAELKVKRLGLRDLILEWINERREYKRRLLNKRVIKVVARIEMLKILIELFSETNLEKTVRIVRGSNKKEVVDKLMKEYGMSSFQAAKVAEMRLSAFTKDSLPMYKEELKERQSELKDLYKCIKSEKYIDEIISAELDELKKYATPRKSQVISLESGVIDTKSEYFIIATKKGYVKKILATDSEYVNSKGYGAFAQMDYPVHILKMKNMDNIFFVDSFGKYSCIPVSSIEPMDLSSIGERVFDYTKLEGEIVSMTYFPSIQDNEYIKESLNTEISIVVVSRDGYIKKLPLSLILDQTKDGSKSVKNSRIAKLRNDDFVAFAGFILDDANILVYTKKGVYAYINCADIPVCGKEAIGNIALDVEPGDACAGCCVVNEKSEYVVVITEKGCAKKCEIAYLGAPTKRRSSSYLTALDVNDNVVYVDTPTAGVFVCTRLNYIELKLDDIKTMSRKAKPAKKIPLQGDSIINVITN